MDYDFDVFLSYRRGERLQPGGAFSVEAEGRWVHSVFLPDFKARLDNHYPGARIAVDVDIPLGVAWETTLQQWVLRSKCLVAVWSPMYFRSPYCRSEFHSMLARERALQAAAAAPIPPQLVLPLAWADGQWFDDEAKARQYAKDFAQFSGFVKPIETEERRDRFITAMDKLCAEVERAISSAPDWDPTWTWKETPPLQPARAFTAATLRA